LRRLAERLQARAGLAQGPLEVLVIEPQIGDKFADIQRHAAPPLYVVVRRITCCRDAGECASDGPACQGAATGSEPCSATTATAHPDTDATPHRTPPAHPARPSPNRPSAQTTAPRHPGPTLPSRTPPVCGSPGRCRTRPAHLCRTAPILPTSAGFSRPDLLALLPPPPPRPGSAAPPAPPTPTTPSPPPPPPRSPAPPPPPPPSRRPGPRHRAPSLPPPACRCPWTDTRQPGVHASNPLCGL